MWKKTGAVYDGDWKDNMRHGFGMYSMKQGDVFVKQYAGGWKEDMRDVSCVIGYASYCRCMYVSAPRGPSQLTERTRFQNPLDFWISLFCVII